MQKRLIYTFIGLCLIIGGLFIGQKYQSAKAAPLSSARNRIAAPPRQGLVGWWSMDTADMSPTGATMYDKSGFNNNGTVTGTTTSTGKIGQSRTFNGTSDKIIKSSFSHGNTLTYSAWTKIGSGGVASNAYLIDTEGGGGIDAGMGIWNNAGYIAVTVDNGTVQNNMNTTPYWLTLSDGQWHHIVATRDSTNAIAVYIDGKLIYGPTVITIASGGQDISQTGAISIGSRSNGDTGYWNGSIDDVRIYNRALSAQEVSNLYNSAKTNYVAAAPRTGLVGWWTMDANDATSTPYVYYDKSGLNNNATSTANPSFVAGKINQAISSNGTTQYLSAVLNAPIAQNGPATISGWYKFTQLASVKGANQYINGNLYQASANNGFYINGTNDLFLNPGSGLTVGVWHHIVFTYSGDTSTALLYVDNVKYTPLIQTGAENIAAIPSLSIGASTIGGGIFGGSVDDVRVYNRVLSAQEVSQLYNSAKRVLVQ